MFPMMTLSFGPKEIVPSFGIVITVNEFGVVDILTLQALVQKSGKGPTLPSALSLLSHCSSCPSLFGLCKTPSQHLVGPQSVIFVEHARLLIFGVLPEEPT